MWPLDMTTAVRFCDSRPFYVLPWDTRRVLRVAVEIIYEKKFLTKLNLLQEYTL